MKADENAYAVLGLEPGAGPVAIEAAYRRLIKRHHPDRKGGDAARAAEINSAYQQLHNRFGDALGRRRGPPVPVRPMRRPARAPRRRWGVALVALIAVAAVSQRDAIGETLAGIHIPVVQPWGRGDTAPLRVSAPVDLSEIPLDRVAIDRSVLDARQIAASGGEAALAAQSRACHRQLQRNPQPSRLDRCIAFDEAVIALLGGNPFDDEGTFGASAVTARHLAAGRLLSHDTLAVESRLARIRTQVELSLAPPEPLPRRRRPVADQLGEPAAEAPPLDGAGEPSGT